MVIIHSTQSPRKSLRLGVPLRPGPALTDRGKDAPVWRRIFRASVMTFSHSLLSILLLSMVPSALAAVDAKPALRVIRDQCVGCHKPGKAKGGLLLTTHEKMMKGGDNGVPVVPGKGADSLLYQSVLKDGDPHMPPKKQLADAEIAALKAWIDGGAPWDVTVFDEPPAPKNVKLAPMPSAYTPVLALALAPDEKRLALARGNAVVLIGLTKPERPVLGKLEGQTEPVQSVAWSADGKWIISGGAAPQLHLDPEGQAAARTL